MEWFTTDHGADAAVLVEEGLGLVVSHPLAQAMGRIRSLLQQFSQGEQSNPLLQSSLLPQTRRLLSRCCQRSRSWHEHHQCAQQQCNPYTAEDGFLLVFLVSQHMSFTLYGLYALHPTPYTIYMDWGAKSLIDLG